VIFRDVSRRLRTARALRRAKAELELRVDERTDELSRKNAELRDRQLVAYEIHDTILQDVIGALMFVDAALDGPGGPQGDDRKSLETARGLLRKCIDGSRRMITDYRRARRSRVDRISCQ
jgi:signal transduction histidine kinase